MADPVVTITNGVPTASVPASGTITTLGMTLVDGANATFGATTDAAVAAGAAGSINAHLRSISRDIAGGITLQTGANTIGAVTQAGAPWSVSGTVNAAQSGAWNITNISGTVSLPTGASTSALQPTNAGQASSTTGQTGNLDMGAVTTAAPSYATGTTNMLSLNLAGGLRVDGSGVTQPVSGTVAATQSGAPWTIKPDGTAWAMTGTSANVNVSNASIAVTGTFWQATQPISAASLPLPSGASTSALQPTNAAQGSTTSGQTGTLVQAAVLTGSPAYTTGQTSPLSLTLAGALRVDGSAVTQPVSGTVAATQSGTWSNRLLDGSGNAITSDARGTERPLSVQILDASGNQITTFGGAGGTSSNFGSAVPTAGTAAGFSDGTNMQLARVFDGDSGAGTQYSLGVLLKTPASGGAVDIGVSGQPLRIDPTGTTTQPVSGTFWQATQPISAASLPLPSGAATSANQATAAAAASTTTGQTGTLAFGAVTTGLPSYTTAQSDPLSLTTSGLLRVDGSNVTQPVSGTLAISGTVAVTQSGTWNITNISGTVSLPTGAATSANQPTNASLGSTTSGQTGNLSLGAVTTAAPGYTTGQTNALSLTTTGLLRVDGSGVTQPVSGTVTANQGGAWTVTQSGTWTVQPGNTANTTPWLMSINQGGNTAAVTAASALKVDGSAVTQPVSGTVTANQGGNWTSRVVGNTGAIVDAAQNAAAPANEIVVGGTYNSAAPTLTSGNSSQLQLDSSGNLNVNVKAGGGAGGTSSTFGAAFPGTGTAAGAEYLSSPPTLVSGNMVALQTDVNGNLKVNIQAGAGSGGTASTFGAAFPGQGTAMGAEYLSTPPSLTSGNMAALQVTSAGSLHSTTDNIAAVSGVSSNFSSATSINTVWILYSSANSASQSSLSGVITQTSTLTAGAFTFEESFDQGNSWVSIPGPRLINPATGAQLANPYTVVASTNQPFQVISAGASQVRARLSTVITGTGTVSFNYTSMPLVNGIPLPVSASQGVAQSSTTSGQIGTLALGAVTTGAPGYFTGNSNALSLDTSGNLRITGTVNAQQFGTWNINNISGTVSLPTGAATSANQPTNAAAASTTSGQTGTLGMGAVTTGSPSYTTGQTDPLSLTTAGALRVDGSAVTQPVSGTFWQATQPVSIAATVNVSAAQSGNWTSRIVGNAGAIVDAVIGNATAPANMIAVGGVFNTTKPTLTTGQSAAFQSNSSGIQLVDGTGGTFPVSGSVGITGTVAVTQSGTWTVQPGNTPNTTAWLVTGTGGTFPITAAALPLPSGAATSANQTNVQGVIGNATAPASMIVTGGVFNTTKPTLTTGQSAAIQVNSSGIQLVDGSSVTQPVSGTFWQATQPVSIAAAVTVAQATAANLNATVVGTGTFAVQAAQSGNWTSRIVGNAGGIMDAAQNAAAPANELVAGGVYNSVQPTITSGNASQLQVDANGNLRVNVMAGGGTGGGTSSSFGATFPTTGTAAGAEYLSSPPALTSGQMVALQVTSAGSLHTTVDNASIAVTGTFWQATQPVSGTVTANQGGAPWSENITQFGGTNISTGTGAGGAGIPRVTISNDSTVNPQTIATWGLAASTQNVATPTNAQVVMGEFNTSPTTIASGNSSPLQLTSAARLIVDGSQVTQPVSGTVGVSGTVAVTQSGTWTMQPGNTANTTPWLTTINQGGNSAVVKAASTAAVAADPALVVAISPNNTVAATQSGTWNITNVSGTISLPTGAATSANQPSNAAQASTTSGQTGTLAMAAVVTGTSAYTNATSQPLNLDGAGNLKVNKFDPAIYNAGTAWTSATGLNTTAPLVNTVADSYATIIGQITQTTTITGGQITFEESYDSGATYVTIPPQRFVDPTTYLPLANPYVCVASVNQRFHIIPSNTGQIRARLSTVIAGTGSVTVVWTQSPVSAVDLTNSICGGDTAAGTTDGGWPIKVGGRAATANPTAVTNGQRANAMFDKLGKQVVVAAPRELRGMSKTSITSGTATNVIAAGGAGVFTDVYAILVTNKSATSVFVDISDGTGVMWTIAAPAGDTRGFSLEAGSAMPQTTANLAWTATVSTAVTSIELTMMYVISL